MSDIKDGGNGRRTGAGGRRSRNTFVTKSGQTIKVHQNLSDRIRSKRDAAARRKAARLAGLPKSPVKRFLYHFQPKRMYRYWFSREGGIMALKLLGIGIIAGFLLLVGVFAYFRKDLPNLKDISGSNIGGSIRYYDKTGQTLLWEDYDAVKRITAPGDQIAQDMKDATIAIEDKDFYKHGGFDVRGILRAGVNDVFGTGGRQGGSTITQQLIKLNYNWTRDISYTRKVKELILAVELERSYSKQEILDGYLNAAPYGNVQYGVETAARDYFQKSAKDLTLDEAAFLAAIPKSPSYYSPYGALYKQDPEAAKADLIGRQHYILDQMLSQGMITQKEHQEAKAKDTLATIHTPKPKYDGMKAPYFVLTTKEQLEAKYGAETVQRGGWKVITTLDLTLQNYAEQQVQKGLKQVKRQGGDQVAFAAEDVKTGQMVALVGNVMFDGEQEAGQVNFAREKLPPGSSIKPYDYVALIDNNTNFGAGSVLYDTKGPLPGYPCTKPLSRTGDCAIDYDLRFPGPLTLRYALGGSRNIPAMKAMLSSDSDPQKSVNKTIAVMKKLMQSPGSPQGEARGDYKCYEDEALTKSAPCYTASSIGDGAYLKLDEHVHGYGTMSRNGLNIPQTYILKIEDSAGKTVDEWKPSKGVQVVRQEAAYIIGDILGDPKASYLASKPHNYKGWKFGFKTGTTNDSKDGWMMGMSTQYAAGVWVGYHNRTKEMTGFMENMTQPIMQGWMRQAHDSLKPEDRARPSGIQTLPAFVVRTHVGVGSVEPSPATDLFPSWYKATNKANSSKKTIDKVSNKLATDCTPARARTEMTDTNANSFSGDRFVAGGANADTSQQDDIHKCDDAKPSIQVISSSANSITVTVTKGTHPLSSVQFPGTINIVIDGQTVQSFPVDDSQSGSPINLAYNYGGTGDKEVTVTVVDSVLYDASDSAGTVNFSSGGGGDLAITSPTDGQSVGGSHTIRWSGGTGPYTVTVDGSTACSNVTTNQCSVTVSGPSGSSHTATVTPTSGSSQTVTFKK
jgi:membrane peptidoglycan carboxypeptidase